MKVFFNATACLGIVLLAACGKPAPAPAPAPVATAPAPAPADTAAVTDGSNPDLNFTLVNATGYDIKELYLSPADVKEWGENMVGEGGVFANGSSEPVTFTGFKSTVAKWDLRAVDADGNEHQYDDLDLTKFEKLTLNAEDAKTE